METLIACAALLLFGYGLVSARLDRTPITAAMIFVAVGLILGPVGFDLFVVEMNSEVVKFIATITLMLILFTDASLIDLKRLRQEYWIPLRLLAIGLPLTMALGYFIAGVFFPGVSLWMLAAMAFILSPTDAALGQAVVTSDQVPVKVRDSIGIESGLNDGIALPRNYGVYGSAHCAGWHHDGFRLLADLWRKANRLWSGCWCCCWLGRRRVD